MWSNFREKVAFSNSVMKTFDSISTVESLYKVKHWNRYIYIYLLSLVLISRPSTIILVRIFWTHLKIWRVPSFKTRRLKDIVVYHWWFVLLGRLHSGTRTLPRNGSAWLSYTHAFQGRGFGTCVFCTEETSSKRIVSSSENWQFSNIGCWISNSKLLFFLIRNLLAVVITTKEYRVTPSY